LKEAGIDWGEPELILYHSEEYRETDLDVEACVALPDPHATSGDIDVRFQVLPAHDLVASLVYEGAFEEMIPAVLELMRWVGLQGHKPVGPLRELHLSGPAHAEGAEASLPVVELQLPVAPVQV
jgi:effector-binding domain-containing protein